MHDHSNEKLKKINRINHKIQTGKMPGNSEDRNKLNQSWLHVWKNQNEVSETVLWAISKHLNNC